MATTSYQRQQAPPYNSINNHDNNSEDGLNSDEEEEERRLSELHGEAADDNNNGTTSNKRKRTNDTKLTEEDAAAAKEFEEKIRKKIARPQFTPELLTSGSKGLVYLRRSFPTRVSKFRTVVDTQKKVNNKMDKRQQDLYKKRQQTSQITMAARYSSSLLTAYTDFARSLFPSLAPADVFLKIEALGSKREVKDFLQVMRDDVRKEYLLKVYNGDVEKVDRLLSELEYGISVGGAGVNALMGGGDGGGYNDDNQEEVQYDDGVAALPRVGVRADAEEMEEEEETVLPAAPPAAPVLVSNPYKKSVVNDSNDNTETSEVSTPDAEKEIEDEERPVDENEGDEQIASTTNKEGEDQIETVFNEEEEAEFEEELKLTDKGVEEDATNDDVIIHEEEEAESQSVNESAVDNTQETLTLVESQEDERFSQAMSDDAPVAEASQDEPDQDDEEENEERFSQFITSKEDIDATQDDSFSQEANTFEERFSQVTDRVTFEEGTFSQENDDDDVQENSATLGQMTSTQLSMEY
ncbi:hypothetical protein QTG54_001601 [Skeletonema marinoi]|uniref:Chromosome segregation in meiosis protein 3 domain-containing protein n=1 Tax=Skeletonema marinoi TaxID=267567 RepID=A0AAD8YJQ7_9STRA|nr:hypothetical protein QTG54_001601 [Skeletonema marinoi]